jgi:carbon-monoxide dehydrogenase large subunit
MMLPEPSGAVMVSTGITEQGQGAETVVAQIAASVIGVPMDAVKVINGDTDTCPPGSGAWASRQTGIVGEAVLQAGIALKKHPWDRRDIVAASRRSARHC